MRKHNLAKLGVFLAASAIGGAAHAFETQATTAAQLVSLVGQANATVERDVITLVPGVDYAVTSPLTVTQPLEIRGPGLSRGCDAMLFDGSFTDPNLRLSGWMGTFRCDGEDGENPGSTVIRYAGTDGENGRVFSVDAGATLTLRHLTVTGGKTGAILRGTGGAGLRVRGRLELFGVVVENNASIGAGAGILVEGNSTNYPFVPNLLVVNSTIRNNFNTTALLPGNVEPGVQATGGGIRLDKSNSVAFILRSTISNNSAGRGAGIASEGVLHITNSTISANGASRNGSGIYLGGAGYLELRSSTVVNNTSRMAPNEAFLTGSAIYLAANARADMFASVVLNNGDCKTQDIAGDCFASTGASFQTLGGNVGDASCGFQLQHLFQNGLFEDTPVDLTAFSRQSVRAFAPLCAGTMEQNLTAIANRDINFTFLDDATITPIRLLGNLANNGGATATHAPFPDATGFPPNPILEGTVALIHFGHMFDPFPSGNLVCPIFDQRGLSFNGINVTCDAGSFQRDVLGQRTADSMAQNMLVVFPDGDGDGLSNRVDPAPVVSSRLFSDVQSGGRTAGTVVTFGDQNLRLFDAFPNPSEGLTAITLSTGGLAPAVVSACNGTVLVEMGPGQTRTISCPAAGPGCVAQNLIGNPGFESGTQGWTALGGTLTSSTEQARTGTKSARVAGRTQSWHGPAYDLRGVATPGKAYRASAYGRIGGATSRTLFLTSKTVCAGEAPVWTHLDTEAATQTAWTKLEGTLVVPACSLDELTLFVEEAPQGFTSGVTLFVDDVAVTGGECESPQLQASLPVITDWGSGYCVELKVQNPSLVATIDYSVVVNRNNSTIYETWNLTQTPVGGNVRLSPFEPWAKQLGPGATSHSLGFCANRNGGSGTNRPSVVSISPIFP